MKNILFLLITFINVTAFSQGYFRAIHEASPTTNNSAIEQIIATIPYQGYEETQEYKGEREYDIFIEKEE